MRKLLSLFALWAMLLAQSPAQVQMDRINSSGVNRVYNAERYIPTGGNIGDGMLAAYAACPAGRLCPIFVPPTVDGSCRPDSTSANFNTPGKPAYVFGYLSCINWTPASGTVIVQDWGTTIVSWLGGLHGIDLRGPCPTVACSGVTAKGVVMAVSNGAVMSDISGNRIGIAGSGFATGIEINGNGGVNAGAFMDLVHGNQVFGNKVGIVDTFLTEGPHLTSNVISQNDIGFDVPASGVDAVLQLNHFDDNITCAIRMAGTSTIKNTYPHFENAGGLAPNYYCITNTSSRYIETGADIRTDAPSGSVTSFGTIASQFAYIDVPLIFSAGQSLTEAYNFTNNSATVRLYPINISYGLIPLDYNASYTGRLDYCPLNSTISQIICIKTFYDQRFDSVTSNTANPPTSGFLRFAKTDSATFRNNVNSGNLNAWSLNGSDQVVIGDTAGVAFNGPLNAPKIGSSGTTINAEYKGSGTLTYTAIGANACQEQPLTITGAASGDVCHGSPAADIGANFSYGGCRVSGASTAQIRVCSGAGGTPSAQTWNGWARH